MIPWLKLVPTWLWWLIALVIVGGVQQWRVFEIEKDLAQLRTDWAEERADLAGQVAAAQELARAEEQRRQRDIEVIRNDANAELDQVIADARDAAGRADGLQRELNRLRASRGATCDTIASQRGEAAASSFDVLADLFVEVEREGRAMAEEADRRGIAGSACERAYEAVEK